MNATNDPLSKATETRRRTPGLRGHIAGAVALAALAVVVATWYWTTRQPPVGAGPGLSHGVMVVGTGAFLTALLAEIRAMNLSDVLELIGEILAGLAGAVWAALKVIGNVVLGLFGWD